MNTIRVDVPVAMTAERVWAALTDPDERRRWFGGEYAIELHDGGAVRIDLPDEGVHASGVVRTVGPPHLLEHTFVDDDAPAIESVCRWGIMRSVEGAHLSFEQAGASDTLAATWSRRLGEADAGAEGDRVHTSLEDAVALLANARRVLLISYIGEEVPRALLAAGFEVSCKSGPGPDQWAVARMDGDLLAWTAQSTPVSPVDIVHNDVGRFDEYLDIAVELGASTYWYHSARTRPPTPHDNRGTWLPDDVSITQRAATEARALRYVDDVYIADAARARSVSR